MAKVLLFSRFERFWHWSQSLLIICMLITGFEIHGSYQLFGFEQATTFHNLFAWTLIGLWLFVIFWHLTTGEWKQYIPSSPNKIIAMMKFYAIDIFLGGGHPFHKTRRLKHNPLQRMAYLSLHVILAPAIWISGLMYLFYTSLDSLIPGGISLSTIALVHTITAFAFIIFLVAHLYLAITMGDKIFGSVKAMIGGYEEE